MGASNWPGLAIPKPEPRWKSKQAKVTAEQKAERECYAQVDRRDSHCCRVCRARVGGVGMLAAVHHHHLEYRSRGGDHSTANVVSLCVRCHSAVHAAEIRLSGDADERNSVGVLNGLKLEKAHESGWKVEGWR
jgi:5-methylcytosine-specific restriction endonuclease McrA